MKGLKISFLLVFLCFSLIALVPINEAKADDEELAVFRPFYEPYGEGTVEVVHNTNLTSITREWNFIGWNISEWFIKIRFCVPKLWVIITGEHVDPAFNVILYVSTDNGTTYPYELWYEVGYIIYTMEHQYGGWCYRDWIANMEYPQYGKPEGLNVSEIFLPTTRIKIQLHRTWFSIFEFYLGTAYWGEIQKPVPPYDYRDASDTYVQYYVQFYASYIEDTIDYKGETFDFPYEKTQSKLKTSSDMILNCMHPSGTVNEVVNKEWGKDSWIILYSSELAMMNLIDLCSIFPDESSHYLVAAKRFITYLFSKQYSNGSFPFILTDGDQHEWYDIPENITETWQVNAGFDDCEVMDGDAIHPPWDELHNVYNPWVGKTVSSWYGTGQRFLNVGLPSGAIIDSAYLKVCSHQDMPASPDLLSHIQGEKGDSLTFSTIADYNARTRTTETVDWDNMGAWTKDVWYTSPNIKTVIQEICNSGLSSDVVIFWEDNGTTTENNYRSIYNWNEDPSKAPKLEITWRYPESWYGYDRIDSFSACAISLMQKYENATGDLDFINDNWNHIFTAKEFIVDLMNTTYWLPVDGYHYNGTHYNKSEMNWLHDCCEAYQGIKDYAYLEGKRGNTTEETYWNNYAGSIANGIRTYFWNETLGRYAGMFYVNNGTQNTAKVYNVITPVVYDIETNLTRASLTVNNYVSWGILSGRYYEKTWAEDYSVFNEYSTMSGMIYNSFYQLINDFNYTTTWMKDKFLEIGKFLFLNPIYPDGDLQNDDGWLDYVNLVNYTYAPEYARLVETSAWIIDGMLKMPNMTELFTYDAAELSAINDTLCQEDIFWNATYGEFKKESGYDWFESMGYPKWIQWLKDNGTYVQWYDYMFLKFLFEHGYLGDEPWWEDSIPPDWIVIVYVERIPNYVPLLLGVCGLICIMFTPYYVIKKLKEGEYSEGIAYGMLIFIISIGLIIFWLWG